MGLGFGLRGSDLGLGLDKKVLKVTPSIYYNAENLGGTALGLGLSLRGPDLGLGLDNAYLKI